MFGRHLQPVFVHKTFNKTSCICRRWSHFHTRAHRNRDCILSCCQKGASQMSKVTFPLFSLWNLLFVNLC